MCMNNWRKGLLALLALAGIITLVGLVWLWPSAATKAGEDFPFNQPQVPGTVVKVDNHLCDSGLTGTRVETAPLIPAGDGGDCRSRQKCGEPAEKRYRIHFDFLLDAVTVRIAASSV